jgi:hypothetical protein
MKRVIDRLVVAGQGISPLIHSNTESFVEWSTETMALRKLIDALYVPVTGKASISGWRKAAKEASAV